MAWVVAAVDAGTKDAPPRVACTRRMIGEALAALNNGKNYYCRNTVHGVAVQLLREGGFQEQPTIRCGDMQELRGEDLANEEDHIVGGMGIFAAEPAWTIYLPLKEV